MPWTRPANLIPLLLLLLLLSGCATGPLRPAPDRLQPWTKALRDSQPDDAFAAVYKAGPERLVFIGAKHANQDDSLTFRMIRGAYAAFAIDTVIAEGFATSRGPNPATVLKYAADSKARPDGFVEGGETVPTALGAQLEGAVLWGGEPDDLALKSLLAADGVSNEDLLGFYVLRNIPQWIGERQIADAGDPRLQPLVTAALAKNRQLLGLPPTVLPDFEQWAAWYAKLNGRPIGPAFVTEEVGPLSDGSFASNRIAHAISRARAAYLHDLVITHLAAGESVLVVFGASHLIIHRPALDDVLGPPCYVGSDMARAAEACR
jgi:hypothetical protein